MVITLWSFVNLNVLFFFTAYHEVCFKTFIGASIIYMLLTCMMLTKYRRRRQTITLSETASVKLKWRSFFVNVGSFAFAAYFFLRHNRLCEPYGKLFGNFFQYIIIFYSLFYWIHTSIHLPGSLTLRNELPVLWCFKEY